MDRSMRAIDAIWQTMPFGVEQKGFQGQIQDGNRPDSLNPSSRPSSVQGSKFQKAAHRSRGPPLHCISCSRTAPKVGHRIGIRIHLGTVAFAHVETVYFAPCPLELLAGLC